MAIRRQLQQLIRFSTPQTAIYSNHPHPLVFRFLLPYSHRKPHLLPTRHKTGKLSCFHVFSSPHHRHRKRHTFSIRHKTVYVLMVKGRQKGKSRCHPSHRRYQREATKTANKINKHLDDTPSIPTRFDGFINTSNSSKFVTIVYSNMFGLVIEESVRGKIK